ncbi:MAG: acetylornithine deacetylase [Aestuariibacter sp.]
MSKLSFLENYRRIIEHNTISSVESGMDESNHALCCYISNIFEQAGFSISIHKVPGTRNKYNFLAQVGHGAGGLLLSGHTDTVPCDEHLWTSSPFALTEKNNRLYGLGSCDMKGFFAFIYEALQTIPLNKLQKPLYILGTADEETSMAGARFFMQQKLIKPDVAIIGEPTELKPIYKHKGHMAHSLKIRGESGHSSDPKRGVNAIEIMHEAIQQLIRLKQSLLSNQDTQFSVPETTMNFGHIHGGDGENRICGHCQLNFDVRPVPGLNDEQVISRIDEALAPLKLQYPDRIERSLMYPTVSSFASRNEYRLLDIAEELLGAKPQIANYCTEAPFINQLGCDTLILGPGSIQQAHQPDEFMALDYINPTVQLLQGLIKKYCF